jgi:hypothetical protein
MAGPASSFQEPSTRLMTDRERQRFHIILSKLGEKATSSALSTSRSMIPAIYDRPARDVVTTLAENTADKMTGWIMGAYEKGIARQLKKGWATA